jgi:hypothetical protein
MYPSQGVTMKSAIRFLWNATRGNRLRPWRSAYLRWRFETYTGQHANSIRLRDFLRLMFAEKAQFLRFLLWTGEIQAYAEGPQRR